MARSKLSKENPGQYATIANDAPEEVKQQFLMESLTNSQESLASAPDNANGSTLSRGSGANSGFPLERWANLSSSPQPFYYTDGNFINPYDVINVCYKAYNSFPLLRNVIEVMVELSNTPLVLKGGNKKINTLISSWMERIGMQHLASQFFREWWRSGSVFLVSFDGTLREEDVKKLDQLYEGIQSKIPLVYTILNPLYIRAKSTLCYQNPIYLRVFGDFELARLRNPKTDEEKAIYNALPDDVKKKLRVGAVIPIDPRTLTVLLYKNQPYEPFATPFCFPLLDLIEAKMDLLRIDKAVAKAADRILFLITVGSPITEHNKGQNINYNTIAMLQQMLNQSSILRTLVAPFDTKGEFLIPDLNKVLGAAKYEQLNNDILQGLNATFFDAKEKFANASVKVKIFVERLEEARRTFLDRFLNKEIRKIAQWANSKSCPIAEFSEVGLRDELAYASLANSMYSVGLLTAEETFENIRTGKFPTAEESLQHQQEFKDQKDEGLYQPLVGNSVALQESMGEEQMQLQKQAQSQNLNNLTKTPPPKSAGRPVGTKSNNKSKKMTPVGASEEQFSMAKLIDNSRRLMDLQTSIEMALKKKFKIEELKDFQLTVANDMAAAIITNETDWEGSIKSYIKKPTAINEEALAEITEIANEHHIGDLEASLLRISKLENE